jgi:hypothetical protein
MNRAKPSPVSTKPRRSKPRSVGWLGGSRRAASRASSPSGRFSPKIQRQPQWVLIQPPTGGPSMKATSPGQVRMAMARTMPSLGVPRSTSMRPTGTIIAPPMPCSVRASVKLHRPCAAAQASEASVNTAMASENTRARRSGRPPSR